MTDVSKNAKFSLGQIVVHQKFAYRGVVYDIDAHFSGTEEWYEQVAKSRPPKDAPWYHVLVDGQLTSTYVAERHLIRAENTLAIDHPLLENYFSGFQGGRYIYLHQQ